MIDLLKRFVKTDEQTTGLSKEMNEVRQQISLIDERMTEMKYHICSSSCKLCGCSEDTKSHFKRFANSCIS